MYNHKHTWFIVHFLEFCFQVNICTASTVIAYVESVSLPRNTEHRCDSYEQHVQHETRSNKVSPCRPTSLKHSPHVQPAKLENLIRLADFIIFRCKHFSTLSSFKAKMKTFLFSQYFHPNYVRKFLLFFLFFFPLPFLRFVLPHQPHSCSRKRAGVSKMALSLQDENKFALIEIEYIPLMGH